MWMTTLFLWGATARCGITLLQRLITSSNEILVFGEDDQVTKRMPEDLRLRGNKSAQAEVSEALNKVKSGDVNFWTSSVLPDFKRYLGHSETYYRNILELYQQTAEECGFSSWGIKDPDPNWNSIEVIYNWFPEAKHIFLIRNIFDVIKSYKARGWIHSQADLMSIVGKWNQNVSNFFKLQKGPNLTILRYENIVSDRDVSVQILKDFLGLKAIDSTVFDSKINVFKGAKSDGFSPDGYIPPVELSNDEVSMIMNASKDVLAQAGYVMD
jgi:hypothetical protein